jgi:hypothetical protein
MFSPGKRRMTIIQMPKETIRNLALVRTAEKKYEGRETTEECDPALCTKVFE